MNGLLDFAQGASNAAAGAVSGNVDMLAWLLRKAGVPVPENALLSRQWMAEKLSSLSADEFEAIQVAGDALKRAFTE